MNKIAFYISILIYSSHSLCASLSDLDEGLKTNILEFLSPDDLQFVRGTDKQFREMLAPNSYLRNHIFDVTLSDGALKTLSEYLQLDNREQVLKVKNLATLMVESRHAFISLMMKAVPNTSESIESGLERFHQETFMIDELISTLPIYVTSHQRLAGVLTELIIWDQVSDIVKKKVLSGIWGQVLDMRGRHHHISLQEKVQLSAQIENQVLEQLWTQVGIHVSDYSSEYALDQIWNQVWGMQAWIIGPKVKCKFSDRLLTQIRHQVSAKISSQVDIDIGKFQFAAAFDNGGLNEPLKLAINYTFTVYQLGALSMRHSKAYKAIHTKLYKYLLRRISEDQASVVLSRLNIPDAPEGNYLVDTQLKLIKRHLSNAE